MTDNVETVDITHGHGWFSDVAAVRHGCVYYQNPMGKRLTLTSVSPSKDVLGSMHSDLVYMGPVTEYLGCDHVKADRNKMFYSP